MLKVGVLTLAIFLTGLAVGYLIDSARSDFLTQEIARANVETESLLTGQLYLENSPNFCEIMSSRIVQLGEVVEQLGADLSNIGEKISFFNTTFLDRRYFLYEIRFWLAAEQYKERCGKDLVTVLFYYDADHPESNDQGLVLTAMKETFGTDLLVFSLQRGYKEPVIALLEQDFEVTSSPTMVINGEKYVGSIDKETLQSIIQKQLPSNSTTSSQA